MDNRRQRTHPVPTGIGILYRRCSPSHDGGTKRSGTGKAILFYNEPPGPTNQPTNHPTNQPTIHPSIHPSIHPPIPASTLFPAKQAFLPDVTRTVPERVVSYGQTTGTAPSHMPIDASNEPGGRRGTKFDA